MGKPRNGAAIYKVG